MAPKFGTSGLRGLVLELTPELVADYTRAFVAACPTGGVVHVGRDLRPSSRDIAGYVTQAVQSCGLDVIDCGAVSTPALALDAITAGHAAIMVTGSHIPADRNGLKFYIPEGEIGKHHEAEILRHLGAGVHATTGGYHANPDCMQRYVERIISAFGNNALAEMRIGVYQHSSVAREAFVEVVERLGATPIVLARSDEFIPVDTEAVDPHVRVMLRDWCTQHALHAVISSDGDADRPMIADETGAVIAGDVIGVLTARAIGANTIVTPISSNTMVHAIPEFVQVDQTKIGSPYVIAQMQAAMQNYPTARVAGYEANGGFLLGFESNGPDGIIPPLMTRDCMLPIIATLWLARSNAQSLSELVNDLPQRFTATDRLTEVPTEKSIRFIADLANNADKRAEFFRDLAPETKVDVTDGLRVTFADNHIVHLRPSGNAPECRCYVETDDPAQTGILITRYLDRLAEALS